MKSKILLYFSAAVTLCMSAVLVANAETIREIKIKDDVLIIIGEGFGNRELGPRDLQNADRTNQRIEWQDAERAEVKNRDPFCRDMNVNYTQKKYKTAKKDGWFNEHLGGVAEYDQQTKYSGAQSIVFDSTTAADGRFHLSYDPGRIFEEGQTAYVSWFAKLGLKKNGIVSFKDTDIVKGQWKMFRLSWRQGVVDTFPELFMTNSFAGNGNIGGAKRLCFLYESSRTKQAPWLKTRFFPSPDDGWVRLEVAITTSTETRLNTNGKLLYRMHRLDKNSRNKHRKYLEQHDYNVNTYVPEYPDRRIRYFVFQNYQGNGLSGHSIVWIDNIYIQEGFSRIEVGDQPEWNRCTHKELLVPSKWENEKITIKLNDADNAATLRRVESTDDKKVYLYIFNNTDNVAASIEVPAFSGL